MVWKSAANWAVRNPKEVMFAAELAKNITRSLFSGGSPQTPSKKQRTYGGSQGTQTPRQTPRRRKAPVAGKVTRRLPLNRVLNAYYKPGGRPGYQSYRLTNRRLGASTSKSSGFFKAGRRQYDAFDQMAKKGVVLCREQGGVLTAPTCNAAWIGHATVTKDVIIDLLSKVIVKFCAGKMQQTINDFDQVIIPNSHARKVIKLIYRRNPSAEPQSANYLIDPTTTTWEILAQNIETTLRSELASNNLEFQFCSLVIASTNSITGSTEVYDRKTFDLYGATVSLVVKSALKIQNRTVNVETGTEDDVDNVPLYGKSYEGSGNFLTFRSHGVYDDANINNHPAEIHFPQSIGVRPMNPVVDLCEAPVITYAAGPQTYFCEPPKLSQLYNAKKIGKAHLDPGQVKTSVLSFSTRINLTKLFRSMARGANSLEIETFSMGNYRVFCLEKMIQAVATSSTNAVKVAYEVDHKIGGYLFAKSPVVTNTIVYNNPG